MRRLPAHVRHELSTARPPAHETSVESPTLRVVRSEAAQSSSQRGRRGRLVRRMLMLADVSGLVLAFASTLLLFRNRVGPTDLFDWRYEVLLFAATLPGWVLLARLHGLYDRDEERASHSTQDDLVGVLHLVTVGSFVFFAGAWMTGLAKPYPSKLLAFWVLAICFVAVARVGARAFARTRADYVQNAVIVGTDVVAKLVARKILDHPEFGVNVVGFVEPAQRPASRSWTG